MRQTSTGFILFVVLLLSTVLTAPTEGASSGRYEQELSGPDWRLWLDLDAPWQNDTAYLPPVDIASVPVNLPSCGWDALTVLGDAAVSVPGTVEEYCWGDNGNIHGIAGDYRGVSWWCRTFALEEALQGKRITLAFDSINLRAEVFVNRKLVGYDVIGNTPFELDITDAVTFDGENTLDIRITDPVGNFTWEDNDIMRWGENSVPAVHGFGGITGRLYLRATDTIHIDDIYIENKPSITEAEVFITLGNSSGETVKGEMTLAVHEWQNPDAVIWTKKFDQQVSSSGVTLPVTVKARGAKPWNIRDPHLYVVTVSFTGTDNVISDSASKRFGFRYFTVKMTDGDRRFYLNGKRVFLFAAMTRGFWPKNGMFPTPEMARRDVEMTLKFGYNAMLFHRAVAQHYVTELCDEAGLLVYEEPSGYRCTPEPDKMAMAWRREKLRRMVIRDRSYPSLVIYNMKNESDLPPSDDDIVNMQLVHELDPGRIVTYNSDRNRDIPYNERVSPDPYKYHLLPHDNTEYRHGWIDHHHWFGFGGYIDYNYNNPEFYLRGVIDAPSIAVPADSLNRLPKDEIIFWGEEGQFGTLMRLGAIRNELMKTGAEGWREQKLLHLYDTYNRFLDDSGFRRFYPEVDDLILSMGRNLHYFHGRSLENVRMGNLSDGFNLNGWAAPETSEDIVGVYRYPTADPSILSYYAQPLYVAVKLRDKVMPTGYEPVADFHLINETNLRGSHTLAVKMTGPDGETAFSETFTVRIAGGETYGQLLVRDVQLPAVTSPGYYTVSATIMKGSEMKAAGHDEMFVANVMTPSGEIPANIAVIDTSGVINKFLRETRGITLPSFDPSKPLPDMIIVGKHDFRQTSSSYQSRYINPLMECAANGGTVIILDQPERWAEMLEDNHRHPALEFDNAIDMDTSGRLFTGDNPVLSGLPSQQGMNWEYQTFYHGPVQGLEMTWKGTDPIVCLASQNRKDITAALTRIPYMRGQIYLSTLTILPRLEDDDPQSSVAKKLFLNLIELSPQGSWKN